MENLSILIGIIGGIVGIAGGLYSIISGKKSNSLSEKALRISEESLKCSYDVIDLDKKNLLLEYETFVMWNTEKTIQLLVDQTKKEVGDFDMYESGYRSTLTVNPFVSTGTAKGIFAVGKGLENEISLSNNKYSQIKVDVAIGMLNTPLYIIYFDQNNLVSIDFFWIFLSVDESEKLVSNKLMDGASIKINSKFDMPIKLDILKLKEPDVIATSTFEAKLKGFINKSGYDDTIVLMSNEELLTDAWEYVKVLKSKYSLIGK